ncbi:hypothetical protein [Novipirellula caenicola]|uniref:SGNH hydrolase-type esterase domain-containing protein n=1 Tax=Novipirellula caenicola TaxID=1536901 RepID=A0ABP9VSW6_9BACT
MQPQTSTDQQTDQHTAWKLCRRLMWFLSPIVILVLVPELALWKTGETWPANHAAYKQQTTTEETLYSREFLSQQFGVYKFATIQLRNPKIIALGSSRVMQFRDFMFSPLEDSFYNAGGMIQSVTELNEYVDLLENQQLPRPEIAIIGIDPWWIKSEYERDKSWLSQQDETYHFAAHVNALRTLVRRNRIPELTTAIIHSNRSPYFGYRAIGTAPIKYGSGFRKDGSWQYSPKILLEIVETHQFIDREDPPIIERIRFHLGNFSVPATVDPAKTSRLFSLLERLQTLGIEVIVLLPPYSSDCMHALSTDAKLKPWWDFYQTRFVESLRSHGMHVNPAVAPQDFGLDDTSMIDGYHPGEVFMGHIALELLRTAPPESLLKQVSAQALQAKIDSAFSPLGFASPEKAISASRDAKAIALTSDAAGP